MRRIRYQVAMSLDGYIAGPQGEADWIVMDPEIDFNALFSEFDTLLLGRKTFAAMAAYGQGGGMPGMKSYVFSRTLRPSDCPGATLVGDGFAETVTKLKEESGKDIWLFGGGGLFRSLLAAGLVDTVEPAVIPVLLGGGIPFLPPPARQTKLKLTGQRVYAQSGIVLLQYAAQPAAAARSRKKKAASSRRR